MKSKIHRDLALFEGAAYDTMESFPTIHENLNLKKTSHRKDLYGFKELYNQVSNTQDLIRNFSVFSQEALNHTKEYFSTGKCNLL